MKLAVLVCDGMADEPIEQLDGRTPLEAAKTPNMDALAREGRVGLTRTIPRGFAPAGDVGALSILGLDPRRYYGGRGPLEAAQMGIALERGEVAFRCNLVTADGDRLVDYSAGRIRSDEAAGLVRGLDEKLGSQALRFYPGKGYRHLLIFRDPGLAEPLLRTVCTPPQDFQGQRILDHWPKGPAAERLVELMKASQGILAGHEVNQVRVDLKENPGNMIWLWGQGTKLDLPTFQERWRLKGSVISAADGVKGAGRLAGLEVVELPGATGSCDTHYEGKGVAASKCLQAQDFVFVHVAAADEAGRNGDLRQKIAAIEAFDRWVVGPVAEELRAAQEGRALVMPGHATPVEKRARSAEPVPFLIWGDGIRPDSAEGLGEAQAKATGWRVEEAHEILPQLLGEAPFRDGPPGEPIP